MYLQLRNITEMRRRKLLQVRTSFDRRESTCELKYLYVFCTHELFIVTAADRNVSNS